MIHLSNYINGELRAPIKKDYLDVYDPSCGEIYAKAPSSTVEDVEAAIKSAEKAFPAWSLTSLEERSKILLRISDLIESRLEELAKAESKDNGKPLWLAKAVDIPRAASNFRFFSQAITQFASESHQTTGRSAINYTLREALGVVACISPWNLPLYLFTWKIAPALAAGNTVVAKPSEVTPMTAYLLSEICNEAGLPAGVLNILHGLGPTIGNSLNVHPTIKAISFTGSTRVGAEISRQAAPLFKKLSLEMGGKNPNIIFDDCNYEKMLETTLRSSFINQGQICLCGSRIYVQEGIYESFIEDFVERTRQMQVGPPALESSRLGAVVSEAHFNKVMSYIALAKEEGGRILTGGHAIQPEGFEKGWYIAPTIIEGLDNNCRTNQEEIFGPVVSVMPFKTEEEAIALANGTSYGLATTLWTEKLSRVHRLAPRLQTGILWVNTWMLRDLRTPFGGVKNSGVGREGGFEALRFFTQSKNVCIQYD
ncbi:MAG: aldehyde dehydrogenase [Bacteroidia bacterium]|nr:aldehyde dehydrogenase [Bacteroidia bacterium]